MSLQTLFDELCIYLVMCMLSYMIKLSAWVYVELIDNQTKTY